MGRRLRHTKPVRHIPENRQQRRLEAQADHMILQGDHAHHERTADISRRQAAKQEHEFGGRFFRSSPPKEGSFERAYFRSVGSVVERDGKWFACDGQGQVVAEYPQRWQAWQHADKYGMERAQEL